MRPWKEVALLPSTSIQLLSEAHGWMMDTLNVLLGLILFLPDPSFTYSTKSLSDHETYNPEHLEEKNTTVNVDSVAGLVDSVTGNLNKCIFGKLVTNPMPGSTIGEWHCSNNYATSECMSGLLEEFLPHFNVQLKEKIKQTYHNTQLELNDFMCNGKENWIDSFNNNGGVACVTRNKDVIQQCVMNETFTLISELTLKSRDASSYSLEKLLCRNILIDGECKWKYMSTCESKKAISLQRELVDVQKNLKACRGQGLMSGSAAVRSTLLQYFLSTVLVLLLNKLRNDITLSDIFV